jgi:hypothetical protein
MAENQHKPNASELWLYFTSLMNWIKATFPKYRKEMKGIELWGFLYNEFKDQNFDHKKLEEEITELNARRRCYEKKGIYEYVLTRKKSI